MTLMLTQAASLVYPIMLAQEAEEISESKAAELIGLNIQTYRERKAQAIKAILDVVTELPSPLALLLEGTKERPG